MQAQEKAMPMAVKQESLHTQSLRASQHGRSPIDRKEKNFLIMARVVDRTYKAEISDGGNLGLSQRCFRPISVD